MHLAVRAKVEEQLGGGPAGGALKAPAGFPCDRQRAAGLRRAGRGCGGGRGCGRAAEGGGGSGARRRWPTTNLQVLQVELHPTVGRDGVAGELGRGQRARRRCRTRVRQRHGRQRKHKAVGTAETRRQAETGRAVARSPQRMSRYLRRARPPSTPSPPAAPAPAAFAPAAAAAAALAVWSRRPSRARHRSGSWPL